MIDLFSPCCYFVNRYEDLTFPKVANAMSELESFHNFLGTQLATGDSALSPEECLDLWRAQHPPDEEARGRSSDDPGGVRRHGGRGPWTTDPRIPDGISHHETNSVMTYRVVILARARQDVDEIYDWIAKRSPDGAQRWLNGFEQATGTLQTNPFIGPPAPESKFFDIEIRHILFHTRSGRTYRAIFVVIDDAVRILRVRGPGQRLVRPRDVNLE